VVRVAHGAGDVVLERLGADGPPLLDRLRRTWLPARVRVLRLAEDLSPPFFGGTFTVQGEEPAAFLGAFHQDLFLSAPEGGDVRPLFLADVGSWEFDPDRYECAATRWDGVRTVFSRLAGRTDDFRREFASARENLSSLAAAAMARHLPTLGLDGQTALASRWLPGRLLSVAELESLAPGFLEAFASSWLAASPRREEGAFLREETPGHRLFLGYASGTAGGEAGMPFTLMLAGRRDGWVLEALSLEDYATYRFTGGEGIPALAGRLLSLPQFSREALYLPLAELSGERADYALPARDLPILAHLRAAFRDRVIHAGGEAWRQALDR
jgi:hypothetical protein